MTTPNWQLPSGVDRGLWDYIHSGEMVAGYDQQMAESPLARADIAFCERALPYPGRLLDLGCGTGRLCRHFAAKGYDCVGVDLSTEMLDRAAKNSCLVGANVRFELANFVEPLGLPEASFDFAACLFSTLGMVRGAQSRAKVVANAFHLLRPGGRFVLHVHNRWFRELGFRQLWKNCLGGVTAGDMTMPQAYGGAPLTLHHFSRSEASTLLKAAGFAVREVLAVGSGGGIAWPAWRVYGYLLLAEKMA